ncbi:MAG: hypothetical protein LBI61_01480 [Puniceicoccales bacterium]|jgi:hypothetical protein|nr:hypothetical protein [Puniceicoccales bacterium]
MSASVNAIAGGIRALTMLPPAKISHSSVNKADGKLPDISAAHASKNYVIPAVPIAERNAVADNRRPATLAECTVANTVAISISEANKLLRVAFASGNLADTLSAIAEDEGGGEVLRRLLNLWTLRSNADLAKACLTWERSSKYSGKFFGEDFECSIKPTETEDASQTKPSQASSVGDATSDKYAASEMFNRIIDYILQPDFFEHAKFQRFRIIRKYIANAAAKYCINPGGKIDITKACRLKSFLANVEIQKKEAYAQVPGLAVAVEQMLVVLDSVCTKKSALVKIINSASDAAVADVGRAILRIMSADSKPLTAAEAILQSLFSAHTQTPGMPTCTIDSYIIERKNNHPEEIASTFLRMVTHGTFRLPSGYSDEQLPVVNGRIFVDLKNGMVGKDTVFADPKGLREMNLAGITYNAARTGVSIPIYDLNDAFFADIFKLSFGNGEINPVLYHVTSFGTLYLCKGITFGSYSTEISCDGKTAEKVMEELRAVAVKIRANAPEARYFRVSTLNYGQDDRHSENLNIDKVLAFDLKEVKDAYKPYVIGDRNWAHPTSGRHASLAVMKLATSKGEKLSFVTSTEFEISSKNAFFAASIASFRVYSIEENVIWERVEPNRNQNPLLPTPPNFGYHRA